MTSCVAAALSPTALNLLMLCCPTHAVSRRHTTSRDPTRVHSCTDGRPHLGPAVHTHAYGTHTELADAQRQEMVPVKLRATLRAPYPRGTLGRGLEAAGPMGLAPASHIVPQHLEAKPPLPSVFPGPTQALWPATFSQDRHGSFWDCLRGRQGGSEVCLDRGPPNPSKPAQWQALLLPVSLWGQVHC